MSVLVVAVTPGMTAEQYDRMAGDATALPPGCTAHHAGPTDDGWRVVSVWDSAEDAARFGREVLGPRMAEAGLAPLPPQVTPLHRSVT